MFQPLPVFVGLRYSLAREHSFFVSFITWVSLLGVALGVLALITVISVMNGFETELRTRLLSLSAHATLSAHGGAIADWRTRIRQLEGVRAHRCGALSRYRRHAEPPSGHERRGGARYRSDARGARIDDWRGHARGQARRSAAGNEPHHSRPHACLSAASGRGRHRDGHDSGRRGPAAPSCRGCRNSRWWGSSRSGCRSTTACWPSSISRMRRRFAVCRVRPASA